jgi:hypothetical protein
MSDISLPRHSCSSNYDVCADECCQQSVYQLYDGIVPLFSTVFRLKYILVRMVPPCLEGKYQPFSREQVVTMLKALVGDTSSCSCHLRVVCHLLLEPDHSPMKNPWLSWPSRNDSPTTFSNCRNTPTHYIFVPSVTFITIDGNKST